MKSLRRIRVGLSSKMTVKQYQGRDHYVVPVVALVEGVVFASNAEAPEYVPASELAKAPAGWDGRPIVLNHPMVGGEPVSANSPEILDQYRIGTIFNTKMEGTKLTMEAWLDKELVDTVDGARELVDAIEAGESVEVSVGALIEAVDSPGEFDNRRYMKVWSGIVPDHLAFLSDDQIGACSNDMGCGASLYFMSAKMKVKQVKDRYAAERPVLAALLGASDQNIRVQLEKLLENERGFLGVEALYPEDGMFTYAAMDMDTYQYDCYMRSYSVTDGKAAVDPNEQPIEVVRQVEYVVMKNGQELRAASACSCRKAAHSQETLSMDKKARVKALIASPKNSFTQDDETYLMGLSDERLQQLENFTPPSADPSSENRAAEQARVATLVTTEVESRMAAIRTAAATMTAEQYVANAPAPVRESLQEGMRAVTEKRTGLIAQLKASGRCDFTDAELQALTLADLEKFVKLANVPVATTTDFSVQSANRSAAAGDHADPAPSLATRLASKRKEAQPAQAQA